LHRGPEFRLLRDAPDEDLHSLLHVQRPRAALQALTGLPRSQDRAVQAARRLAARACKAASHSKGWGAVARGQIAVNVIRMGRTGVYLLSAGGRSGQAPLRVSGGYRQARGHGRPGFARCARAPPWRRGSHPVLAGRSPKSPGRPARLHRASVQLIEEDCWFR